MKGTVKLDQKDRKILLELDTDATASLNSIAKKLRTTKEAVSYRIHQLEEKRIIQNYTAIYNTSKLGLTYFKLYIKFSHITEKKKMEIIQFVRNKTNFSWLASSEGSFDLMIGMHFSSISEFEKYRDELFRKFDSFIQRSSFAILTEGEAYPRQYILGTKNPMRKVFLFCNDAKKEILDSEDLLIIKGLSLSARSPIREIAKSIKLTPRIVNYRKKILEKKGVIVGYKIFINHRSLNYIMAKCLVNLHKLSPERYKDFKLYVRQHPNIVYCMKVLGEWDFELDIEFESMEEFYRIANEIRDKFSDVMQNFDTLIVTEDWAVPHQIGSRYVL
jgi:DNA-binding Lrp family transcriptional regulator